MMNIPFSNLSYEFYYLLRTEVEQPQRFWREPPSLSMVPTPSITETGILIDHDKRLFRYSAFTTVNLSKDKIDDDENKEEEEEPILPQAAPLEDWLEHLKQGWKKVQRCYSQHFENQSISEMQAYTFCHQSLLGIALLINDTSLEAHTVTVPFKGPDDSIATQIIFKPDTWLLQVAHTVSDSEDNEAIPFHALLARFEPQFQIIPQTKHWQIQLDSSIPHLTPMEITQNTANPIFAPNPIFAVYGLEHSDSLQDDESMVISELQDFLLGREPAILVRVLPRLLFQKWQFTRMDFAARMVRHFLQTQGQYYQQIQLPCLSNRKLSDSLQAMAEATADTSLLMGKLQQASKTLEIHRNNLERRLRRARRFNSNWNVLWQHNEEAPLLDNFNTDQQKLQNHITYLQGELTYLEGIRQRWHLHFEGRQLAWTERLGSLGSILAFLVAVGAASLTAVSLSNPTPTDHNSLLSPVVQMFRMLQAEPIVADLIILLRQPIVYWFLVLIFLLPIFWQIGKTIGRKMRCSRFWRWGITLALLSPAVWYASQVIMRLL
jgi:hypothetical protein